jgi:transposase
MTQAVPGGHAVRMEDLPDPKVGERASRRTYTAKYELEVLSDYERWTRPATVPCRARRGPYTSLSSAWCEQRDKGALAAASRGPRPVDPQALENERLMADNARLQASFTETSADLAPHCRTE